MAAALPTDPVSMASVIGVVIALLVVFLMLVVTLLYAYKKNRLCFKGQSNAIITGNAYAVPAVHDSLLSPSITLCSAYKQVMEQLRHCGLAEQRMLWRNSATMRDDTFNMFYFHSFFDLPKVYAYYIKKFV